MQWVYYAARGEIKRNNDMEGLDLLTKGGPLMWVILGCSVAALALFFERLYHITNARVDADTFLEEVTELIADGRVDNAKRVSDETPGPLASVISAACAGSGGGRDRLKEAVEEVGRREVARLEKNLPGLATIAHVTPLLGLLGTVTGMIKVFKQIQFHGGVVGPGELAGGIWEALLTTAFGLGVAIPVFVSYNYLVSRVNSIALDMERGATEVIDLLVDNGAGGK